MPPPARGWMREAQTGVIGISLTPPTSHEVHCLADSSHRIPLRLSNSRERNAASPSSSKISETLLPALASTASSRSMKGQQSSCESFLPTLLLPHPINPIRLIIIFVIFTNRQLYERGIFAPPRRGRDPRSGRGPLKYNVCSLK